LGFPWIGFAEEIADLAAERIGDLFQYIDAYADGAAFKPTNVGPVNARIDGQGLLR
jgi:hypothetical protein